MTQEALEKKREYNRLYMQKKRQTQAYKDYIKKYKEEHAKEIKKGKKRYYLTHQEKIKEYNESVKEHRKVYLKNYQTEHREKHKETSRKWNNKHATQKRSFNKFCKEDLSKIENYEDAMKDNLKNWHIHHKLETRGFGYSRKELIALELYYNRPASELIFLRNSDHRKVHSQFKSKVEIEKL